MDLKKCDVCNIYKTLDEFPKLKSGNPRNNCRVCRRKEQLEIAYRDPISYKLGNIKSKCKAKRILYSLEYSDLAPLPQICPVLKIPINLRLGEGNKNYDDIPSVDKMLPEYPYIKGNARIISFRANMLKNNASIEELKLLLEDALRIEESRSILEKQFKEHIEGLELNENGETTKKKHP